MDTLLVGSTGYFTKDIIKSIFPTDIVVVCDKEHEDDKESNISYFKQPVMSDKFRRLFDTFAFERVIYLSNTLNRDSAGVGEMEELRRVLSLSQKNMARQFVYIVSDEALADNDSSDSVIYASTQNLCRFYAENYNLETKIIYSPYLISSAFKDDYWCRILKRIENKEAVEIGSQEDEVAHFLKTSDLGEFLVRLFDEWGYLTGTGKEYTKALDEIYLKSGAKTTYGEIRNIILKFYPEAVISFGGSGIKIKLEYGEDRARQIYGWFAQNDACWDFDEYIKSYQKLYSKKPTFAQRISSKFKVSRRLLMIIELVLGAALVEVYNYLSDGSVQFRMIDVRLLFVILMSLIYGTRIGMITAFVEIASLVFAYQLEGTNVVFLFYDPGNWIAFILLLVAAAICGYIKQKRDEDISFVNEENEALKSENAFVVQLYQEAMNYKSKYKADLIGSRDGFGRIFDVVKRLSTTVPEEIFAESIPVMEDVLNNKSIAIYTINDSNARFARLNVCSEQIGKKLKKSINLDEYTNVLDTLKENDIWFNRDVKEGYPTYVAGIKSEGIVTVLIMIYHVEYLQVGTYYSNLIRILSGLMENFILKAWEYQNAVASRTYIEGTNITRPEYFKQQYQIQKEMMDNRLTSFRLFRILPEGRKLTEMDEILQSKVRNNDILGLGEDGNIYLLASQVDQSSENIVLKRFIDMGLACDMITDYA